MSGIAAAILGAGAAGAGASIFGALTQKSATNNAIAAQKSMFDTSVSENQPFVTAGQGAAGTLADLLKPGGDMTSLLKTIPGFDFINQLSQMGVANQGTTTGLGGNTLVAGANAGTNIALSSGWQPIVGALQNLVSSGVGAAGNITGSATGTGAGIASSTIGGGNAIAAGTVGAANSIGSSITTTALLQKLLNPQNNMYQTAADAGRGGGSAVGSGNYNFLDAAAA